TATLVTYTISGKVATAAGAAVAGASVSTTGASATTAADGSFTLSGLAAGTYSVSASATGYTMDGPKSVTLGPSQTGVNFTATAAGTSSVQGTVVARAHPTAASKTIVSPAFSTSGSNQ